jgi:NADH-quinone oxidoreductase subunit M
VNAGILPLLVLLPLAGGLVAWTLGRRSAGAARWAALCSLVLGLAVLAVTAATVSSAPRPGAWLAVFSTSWIPHYGIRIHLGLDGLSLVMIGLTYFLGGVAVLVSWRSVRLRVGFFHFNLLLVLAGVVGVFLALDLFLFYFFWELMLLPMALLIAIWGSERRTAAALKFFIFTQAGGLLLLVSAVGLVVAHARATGVVTFDFLDLLGTPVESAAGTWMFLGFLAAFAVKLPALPLHTWLPDAHTEAPTAGSVVLAGLLLKTGAYGMLRFAVPLFPDAAHRLSPWLMALGAAGVVYGAWLAFAQSDLKRLVAYTSVSHLGFVLLGIFAWNELALEGVVMQMICHGLSTGALFVVVGALYERLHTREMGEMGGLWAEAPVMASAGLFFALASLGLPGLGNFVAEFLVLIGSFRVGTAATIAATTGLVAATVYALWLVQRTFQGPNRRGVRLADLTPMELGVLLAMGLALVWLGLFPQPVLDAAKPALEGLQAAAGAGGLL